VGVAQASIAQAQSYITKATLLRHPATSLSRTLDDYGQHRLPINSLPYFVIKAKFYSYS